MSKIFNDPIHGTIMLDPLLVKIIDTPQFQRLRNIKQLGGCYFVYPAASHNRFEHSIGTCFLASKLAHNLKQRLDQDIEKLGKDDEKKMYVEKLEKAKMTPEDLLCIEIAGLCHDIGHGPYSHLFDRLFNKAMKKKDPSTVEWQHEDVSSRMIDHMIKTNKDLQEEFVNRFPSDWKDRVKFIKDLIEGNKEKTDKKAIYYMYEIVANKRNEIDVDKMDYFARDCHGLGMKSNFDHLRYISQCRVVFSSDKPDETTIAVRDKEEYNLYELFHTRIGLFRRAYYHKVNKAIELMLTDALVAANDHLDIPTDERLTDAPVAANDPLVIPTDERLTDALVAANDHLAIPTDERLTDAPVAANDHLAIPTDKGSSVKTVKMSEAYQHMSAYEKLTDSIVDDILKSTNKELTEAKTLINRIYKRKLYKLVGQTAPKQNVAEQKLIEIEEDLLQDEELITKDDFQVQKLTFSYGMKKKNPITSVYFYKKGSFECFKGEEPTKTSLFLPSGDFQEEIVFVYSTSLDDKKFNKLSWKWDVMKIMEDAKDAIKIMEDAKNAMKINKDAKDALKIIENAEDAMKRIEDAKDAMKRIEDEKDAMKRIEDAKDAMKRIEDAKDAMTKIEDAKDALKIIKDAKMAMNKTEDAKDALKIIEDAKDAMKKIEDAKDALKKIENAKDAMNQNEDRKDVWKIIEDAKDAMKKMEDAQDALKNKRR
ncbi:deoxynucleoside triphosphate triphosphohydrolase SAMHD1-like [Mytilus trossulus]|uniref:deoxynucleoside triphosphate triphosphohydrolase SAMHD1-like n=1 Tax=Mytilus trossulus TaxID=6551 RepID=UPI0030053FB1